MLNKPTTTSPTNSAAVRAAATLSPVAVTHAEGEYRITYRTADLARANPQLSGVAVIRELAESKAQYCTDHTEALETVRLMIANAARWTRCNDTHPDTQSDAEPEPGMSQPAPAPATQSQVWAADALARALAVTPAQIKQVQETRYTLASKPFAEQLAAMLSLVDTFRAAYGA